MSYFVKALINHLVSAKPLIAYLIRGRDRENIMDKYDALVDEIVSAISEINTDQEGGDSDAGSDMAD